MREGLDEEDRRTAREGEERERAAGERKAAIVGVADEEPNDGLSAGVGAGEGVETETAGGAHSEVARVANVFGEISEARGEEDSGSGGADVDTATAPLARVRLWPLTTCAHEGSFDGEGERSSTGLLVCVGEEGEVAGGGEDGRGVEEESSEEQRGKEERGVGVLT